MSARVFPLSIYARERPVYAALTFGQLLPPAYILRDLEAALGNDPWAPDLRLDRARILERMAK